MSFRISVACAAMLAASGCNHAAQRDHVERETYRGGALTLESGAVLPALTIAYETYGSLAPDGRNAILIAHGFTMSHHAAGKHGWWDDLIGPGKAIDTDRYFVISSNMLGSSFGSTAPASIDPMTGHPWGPDFPDITLTDIVRAQKVLLDALGVHHLVAVAGPSFGGLQAFQWAVTYPSFVSGAIVVTSGPKASTVDPGSKELEARLATDPNWNGGRYYDRGGIYPTLLALRLEMLERYGQDVRAPRIREQAADWARRFDPSSLLVLRRAAERFDVEHDFAKIRAKVLYVLSRTDKLYPPSLAPQVMDALARAGVDARYVEIDTELGHAANTMETAKWEPALRAFLARLER